MKTLTLITAVIILLIGLVSCKEKEPELLYNHFEIEGNDIYEIKVYEDTMIKNLLVVFFRLAIVL